MGDRGLSGHTFFSRSLSDGGGLQIPDWFQITIPTGGRVGAKFPLIVPPRKFAGTRDSCNVSVISRSFKAPFPNGFLCIRADTLWCVSFYENHLCFRGFRTHFSHCLIGVGLRGISFPDLV